MDRELSQDQPSINVFDEIDRLCRKFRLQWQKGPRPQLENFLECGDSQARQNLFRNLLHIDIEARRRSHDQPSSDDYAERFPEFVRIIRQAFFESSMSSVTTDQEAPQLSETISREAPAANRLGEYCILGELGRGGFGVVYHAEHVQRGNRVALKTLPTGLDSKHHLLEDAERLHKFRREFRRMADMSHPNLVGMQTLEVDGSQWFFTMDLVHGVDYLSYVRPQGNLHESRLRATLPQLISGVMALHGQHIVHRDLKPGNVMVNDDSHVVILDFGLVAELQERTDVTRSAHFAGTPAYAAPEQLSERSTAAADWYAIGVMLYEALTGTLPFHGSWIQVLEKKRKEDAPRLLGREGVPQDLAQLADDLLARDPQQRPDALALSKAVSASTAQLPSRRQGDQFLVGRDAQLAALEQSHQRLVDQRESSIVFIQGRSGEGKTSLVDHFLRPLRRHRELAILSGRCYDRESVPLKALDSVIDELCTYLRARKDDVAGLMPDDIRMLSHLFPVLRRVEAVARAAGDQPVQVDMKQVRQRGFRALREMLRRIGQQTPVILFIDDLQWGDSDSAHAIFEMLQPPDAPAVLLLGSFRSDEAVKSPFLAEWHQRQDAAGIESRVISVGPLTQEECLDLIITRTERNTDSVRRRAVELFHETGGNAYLLNELIDCFDADTDSFRKLPLHEVIEQKMQQLPAEADSLLQVIAVSGQAILLPEASQAAGLGSPAISTLTHMRTARLVRLIGSEEQQQVDTYHDKIRETVMEQLTRQERCAIHLRLANVIEQNEGSEGEALLDRLEQGDAAVEGPDRAYDLAYHFDAGVDERKALAYSILAAEQAKRQFALELAISHYQTALDYAEHANSRIRYRISAGIGEASVLAGRYEQASRFLQNAFAQTDDAFEKAHIELLQGNLAYHSKPLSESVATYERALRRVGNFVPRTRIGFRFAFASQSLLLTARHRISRRWNVSETSPDPRALLSIKALSLAGLAAAFHDAHRMRWFMISAFNRASRFPRSKSTASIYTAYASSLAILSRSPSRSADLHQQGYDIVAASDDVAAQAFALRHQGFGFWVQARYADSIDRLKHAIELLESRAADTWQLVYSLFWISCVHYRAGDLVDAINEARKAFEIAFEHDQHRLAQSVIEPWARAANGNIPFDKLRSSFEPVPDDFTSSVQILVAEAYWHLHHRRTAEAVDAAQRAVDIAGRGFRINAFTSPAFSTLARSLRERAEELEQLDLWQSAALRKSGLRIAKRAVGVAKRYVTERPEALRELSLALAATGHPQKALKFSQKSCGVAEDQHARYEYAQSLQVCGQLGQQLGRPDAKRQIEKANALMAEFSEMINAATARSSTVSKEMR